MHVDAAYPLDARGVRQAFEHLGGGHATGGGKTGQSEAMALGVARALCKIDHEANYGPLRAAGQLTRDSRIVERKKYGLRGARRAFQFSKR